MPTHWLRAEPTFEQQARAAQPSQHPALLCMHFTWDRCRKDQESCFTSHRDLAPSALECFTEYWLKSCPESIFSELGFPFQNKQSLIQHILLQALPLCKASAVAADAPGAAGAETQEGANESLHLLHSSLAEELNTKMQTGLLRRQWKTRISGLQVVDNHWNNNERMGLAAVICSLVPAVL